MLRRFVIGWCCVFLCMHASASFWNESVGSLSVVGNPQPGQSFTVGFSACANRNSSGYLTVSFYYSNQPTLNGTAQYLGSGQTYLAHPGSYCSSYTTTQLTLPTTSYNANCIIGGTSNYIIATVGSDVRAQSFNLGPALPGITGFSPQSGVAGTPVTIDGYSFNGNTSVYFDGVAASSTLINSTEIVAYVPVGATTGKITVESGGSNYAYCIPSYGTSSDDFTVYCDSGAAWSGYGEIDYVATSEFTNNVIGTPVCPYYTDNTHLVGTAARGQNKTFYVQLGTCGSADYSKLMKVYADWNQDGDFSDPGEYLLNAPSVAANVLYSFNVAVPSGASLGTTRVRIITALYYSGYVNTAADVDACTVFPFGETQDYSLQISAASAKTLMDSEPEDSGLGHPVFLENNPVWSDEIPTEGMLSPEEAGDFSDR